MERSAGGLVHPRFEISEKDSSALSVGADCAWVGIAGASGTWSFVAVDLILMSLCSFSIVGPTRLVPVHPSIRTIGRAVSLLRMPFMPDTRYARPEMPFPSDPPGGVA